MSGGRPSLYRPEYGEQARKLALLGLTDEQIAGVFGVNPDTIYEWDKRHPEFSEARARGKVIADAHVAASLYERALGYQHDDIHITTYQGDVTETPIRKYYPPDTQAAQLWLSNRQKDIWKIRNDHEVNVDLNMHRVIAEAPLTEQKWIEAHAEEIEDKADE